MEIYIWLLFYTASDSFPGGIFSIPFDFFASFPFPPFLLFSYLFLRLEVVPEIQVRDLRDAYSASRGGERHLQPSDTFRGL